MLSSQHATIGGAVGLMTGNPVLGFLAGVASHHILDMIPHVDGLPEETQPKRYSSRKRDEWPRSEYIIAYTDSLLTLIILVFLVFKMDSYHKVVLMMCGAVGGVFPDLLDNVPFWKKYFRATKFGRWYHDQVHCRLHFHFQDAHGYKLVLALGLQIFITIGGIWVILHV